MICKRPSINKTYRASEMNIVLKRKCKGLIFLFFYRQFPCLQPKFPVWEGARGCQGHHPSLSRWLQIHPQLGTSHGHWLRKKKTFYFTQSPKMPQNISVVAPGTHNRLLPYGFCSVAYVSVQLWRLHSCFCNKTSVNKQHGQMYQTVLKSSTLVTITC